jgi:hypothetical protein
LRRGHFKVNSTNSAILKRDKPANELHGLITQVREEEKRLEGGRKRERGGKGRWED